MKLERIMHDSDMTIRMTIPELEEFIAKRFPQVKGKYRIDSLEYGNIVVMMAVGKEDLRPGGTVSGPTIFALADVSVYLALLAVIGPVELAVTTNCSIEFMRKPDCNVLVSRSNLLKVGRRLAFGSVLISCADREEPVASASLTYAIP